MRQERHPGADLVSPTWRSGLISSAQARSRFKNTRTVLVLDEHRLTCECLARSVSDHCPDLLILLADLDEAAQTGLLAYAPDLIIVNAHRRPRFDLDLPDITMFPMIVIGELGNEGDGNSRAIAFPPNANVALLIAAIRLTLAGGRFVMPERSQIPLNH